MSFVVAGLGNPGRSYSATNHNIGFLVVEELARRHGGKWRRGKRAESCELPALGVELVKPTTFMNRSGEALSGYRADRLVVIHDDLDLEPGSVRVKMGGGAGGHNGLKSIISRVGPDFARVRVGIGRPPSGAAIEHVLGRMPPEVRDAVPHAADAVESVVRLGPEAAMNHFNVRV